MGGEVEGERDKETKKRNLGEFSAKRCIEELSPGQLLFLLFWSLKRYFHPLFNTLPAYPFWLLVYLWTFTRTQRWPDLTPLTLISEKCFPVFSLSLSLSSRALCVSHISFSLWTRGFSCWLRPPQSSHCRSVFAWGIFFFFTASHPHISPFTVGSVYFTL